MPRHRSARVETLGPLRRRPVAPAGSSNRQPPRPWLRRGVVIGLVVLSLALLSAYFKESSNGQAARRPGRRGDDPQPVPGRGRARRAAVPGSRRLGRRRVRREVREREAPRRERPPARAADPVEDGRFVQNVELRRLLSYRNGPSFPHDYVGVAAQIIGRTPGQFEQQIVDRHRHEPPRPRQRPRRDGRTASSAR